MFVPARCCSASNHRAVAGERNMAMPIARLSAALLLLMLVGCGGLSAAPGPTNATTPPVEAVPPSAIASAAPTTTPKPTAAPSTPVTATTRAVSSILDACPLNDLAAAPITIAGSDGAQLEGALVGEGQVGVVLSNQNDNDVCPWLSFARTLHDDGYQVLLYRYSAAGARPSNDLAAAVAALQAQGVERIMLVGASIGASATVVVASQNPPGVVAAVPLSAVGVSDGRSITRFATHPVRHRRQGRVGVEPGGAADAPACAKRPKATHRGAGHGPRLGVARRPGGA
jgi:hypothetical protein